MLWVRLFSRIYVMSACTERAPSLFLNNNIIIGSTYFFKNQSFSRVGGVVCMVCEFAFHLFLVC